MPFGLPNPLVYIAGGTGLILVVALGVQTFRLTLAQRDVAVARQHQAEAETIGAKVNEIFAREEAANEKRRSEQAAANAKQIMDLQDAQAFIETKYKNVSADRAKVAAENLRFRNNAPKTDSRFVGPTMVRVLNCLREQQQASRSGSVATPCGGN